MSLWLSFQGRWKLGWKDSMRNSSQLPKQDYEALLERCLRNHCLFEDSIFPATLNSISRGPLLQKLPPRLLWRKPPELHSNPEFYSAKAKRLDLCQGVVGDCWFLAALQALTSYWEILSRVVPLHQSFTEKYAGTFRFWFWHFGKWVPVVIDDHLPVNEVGQLVFVSSNCKNLFCGALLEKAYAKLSGSYEDLQFGEVSETLVDFTGGVTVTINLAEAPDNLWDILTQATYSRTLIGCQTHLEKERVLENGLVGGHAYTLTLIGKVTCKCGPEYLVKLQNPWGKEEWKGDWSDRMTPQDFKVHFMLLVICKLTPGLLSQEGGWKWTYTMQEGRWESGSTAGDRMKSFREDYDSQRRLPPEFFWENAPLSPPEAFCTEREVSQELWLETGAYIIVPCTSEAHQALELVLRVFSRKHLFFGIGSKSTAVFSKEIVYQNEGQDEFFTRLFEKYPEINALQLQKILNHVTWTSLGCAQPVFSLDTCQGILALLDLNASGTVNIQEFRDLWKQLMLYQEVFHRQGHTGAGYLNWAQLWAAVKEAGIMLSDDICQLMLIRYGSPSLQIGFVNFVHLMLRAENMEDVFQNLTQDGKGIYLQKPEWLMMALYS